MSAADFTVVRPDGRPPSNSLVMIDQAQGSVAHADPSAPQLRVDDLSPHRGDGIFETVLVTLHPAQGDQHGQVGHTGQAARLHSVDAHFERFKNSAAMLELPEPNRELFDTAVDMVIADAVAHNPGVTMLSVRYSMTRGVEGTTGRPSAWAITLPVDAKFARLRETGLRVMTLDRGYDAYFGAQAPWQLIGAKTLSYAANQAAGRWVHQHGADECLYVSHDGVVLEGPSCNLLVKRGQELLTPDPKAGLLHGTTQQRAFNRAAEAGYLCSYQDLTPGDLAGADAMWMLSSTRMAVPISKLDDTDIAIDREMTDQLVDWLLAAD